MNTKESFIHSIETKLEQAQVTLTRFRGETEWLVADDRSKHAKIVQDIDLKVDALKAKLEELNGVTTGAWEQLIDGVESTWSDLQLTLQDVVTSFAD